MKPLRLPTIKAVRAALTAVKDRTGAANAELYVKAGRSLLVQVAPWRPVAARSPGSEDWRLHVGSTEENGWALRAGGSKRALFLAESGDLPKAGGWRRLNRHSPRAGSLRLPRPVRRQRPPLGAASDPGGNANPTGTRRAATAARPKASVAPGPMASGANQPEEAPEAFCLEFVRGVVERTRAEVPGSRLIRALLEDGVSASVLANGFGVTGRTSLRLAKVELSFDVERNGNRAACRLYRAARDLAAFDAADIAAEIVDRLTLATSAPAPLPSGGEIALSPPLAAHLLALLSPLFSGRDGWQALTRLSSGGALGPSDLRIADDGGLSGGWLESRVDDEGVPTRSVELVRDGAPGEPLLTWDDDGWSGHAAAGCRRRQGWRAPPEACHSHLHVAPGPVAATAIRDDPRRGCHLIDCAPGGRRQARLGLSGHDPEPSFEIDVTGFVTERGRAVGAIPRARLAGSVAQLFRGIRAVGDDLRFLPVPGAVGAPTLLVSGLRLAPVA